MPRAFNASATARLRGLVRLLPLPCTNTTSPGIGHASMSLMVAGIFSSAVPRTEADFDPGAKYHVPANVPYTRYFLAHILQYQFHRALCREAGYTGPLHRCTFFGNKAAGARLAAMLEAGQSRRWQDILFDATGERRLAAIDAQYP